MTFQYRLSKITKNSSWGDILILFIHSVIIKIVNQRQTRAEYLYYSTEFEIKCENC